ncbi:metallo-beta-lactamase superfamily protein [Colletotrichum truncatum]|uniref:Metallo-beta-lactamase superfamily protein n=1 Tax=Colletotrichum truncatum TaxID=5467 RepID=A0ACC3YYQ1_COLTU
MNPLQVRAGPRPAPADVFFRLLSNTPLSRQSSNKAFYATKSVYDVVTRHRTPSEKCPHHRTSLDVQKGRPLARRSRHCSYSNKLASFYSTEACAARQPIIHDVFETGTGTWQYIVADPTTLDAVIIDPVLDFDRETQTIKTVSADGLLHLIKEKGYRIVRILETHAHADHITAASYLQRYLTSKVGYRPTVGIGKRIGQVQKCFSPRYEVPVDEYEGVFDNFFEDDESFSIGHLQATAIHLPGHTPDHLGYKIGGNPS